MSSGAWRGQPGMSAREEMAPVVVRRAARPYVGIRRTVTLATFGVVADEMPRLFRWTATHGVQTAGPPFFRFHVVVEAALLDVEAGVEVVEAVPGDGHVVGGLLPAGRYATLAAHGRPSELAPLITRLLAWTAEQELVLDRSPAAAGERWGCRLETYRTCPHRHPELDEWDVELAFRLAD